MVQTSDGRSTTFLGDEGESRMQLALARGIPRHRHWGFARPGRVAGQVARETPLPTRMAQRQTRVPRRPRGPMRYGEATRFARDGTDRGETRQHLCDGQPRSGQLVHAAGLHDCPPSAYWVKRYGGDYDYKLTFFSYLGCTPDYLPVGDGSGNSGPQSRDPRRTPRLLSSHLPWVAEADGHVFLHNGLSPELDCPAPVQLECLHRKVWDRAIVNPRFGTATDRLFAPEYPVWIGADKKLLRPRTPLPRRGEGAGERGTSRSTPRWTGMAHPHRHIGRDRRTTHRVRTHRPDRRAGVRLQHRVSRDSRPSATRLPSSTVGPPCRFRLRRPATELTSTARQAPLRRARGWAG